MSRSKGSVISKWESNEIQGAVVYEPIIMITNKCFEAIELHSGHTLKSIHRKHLRTLTTRLVSHLNGNIYFAPENPHLTFFMSPLFQQNVLELKERAQALRSSYKNLRTISNTSPLEILHGKIRSHLKNPHDKVDIEDFSSAIVAASDDIKVNLSRYSDQANKSYFIEVCKYVYRDLRDTRLSLLDLFRSNDFLSFAEIVNVEILIPLNGPKLHGPNLQKLIDKHKNLLECGYFGNRKPTTIKPEDDLKNSRRTMRRKLREVSDSRLFEVELGIEGAEQKVPEYIFSLTRDL